MMLYKMRQKNIIQIYQKFLIIHAEYEKLDAADLEKQVHYLI